MCVVLAPRKRTSRQLSLLGLASENVEVTACVSPSVSLWQPWRVAWQAGGMALAVGICPAHPRTAVEPQTPVLGEGLRFGPLTQLLLTQYEAAVEVCGRPPLDGVRSGLGPYVGRRCVESGFLGKKRSYTLGVRQVPLFSSSFYFVLFQERDRVTPSPPLPSSLHCPLLACCLHPALGPETLPLSSVGRATSRMYFEGPRSS